MQQTNSEPRYASPVKAIRAFCLDCVGGSVQEVRLCPAKKCALYPYRFGKNPFKPKREYSEEERAKMAERLAKARSLSADKEKAAKNDFWCAADNLLGFGYKTRN